MGWGCRHLNHCDSQSFATSLPALEWPRNLVGVPVSELEHRLIPSEDLDCLEWGGCSVMGVPRSYVLLSVLVLAFA